MHTKKGINSFGGNFRKEPFLNVYLRLGGKIDAKYVSILNDVGFSLSKIRNSNYIIHRRARQPKTYLHRMIMEKDLGRKLLKKEFVDHIDGNTLNNKTKNLRICSNAENLRNRKSAPSDNKSGAMGVVLCKKTGKWAAEIRLNGKKIWLGRHAIKKDAIAARRKAEKKYWGEFAPDWA